MFIKDIQRPRIHVLLISGVEIGAVVLSVYAYWLKFRLSAETNMEVLLSDPWWAWVDPFHMLLDYLASDFTGYVDFYDLRTFANVLFGLGLFCSLGVPLTTWVGFLIKRRGQEKKGFVRFSRGAPKRPWPDTEKGTGVDFEDSRSN